MSFNRKQNFGERHPLIESDKYFNGHLTDRTCGSSAATHWGSLSSFGDLSIDDNSSAPTAHRLQNGQRLTGVAPRPLINDNPFGTYANFPSSQTNGLFPRPSENYYHQNGSRCSSTSNFTNLRHGPDEYLIEEVPPPPEQRKRRQKYLPPTRPDVELFNEKNHIQPGTLWERQFGVANDTNLSVSCEDGNISKNLVQHFEDCGFSDAILRNIELRKYTTLTQIQKIAIPLIRKSQNDLMAHAQTGSGKSAAFLLPIVNHIQLIRQKLPDKRAVNRDSPYALVIEPTKELACQLWEEARSFAINTGVSVQRTYGDMPMRESRRLIESGCDICIATCGRLLHFVMEGIIKLENLHFLVLDEADKLLTCEHFNHCISHIKGSPSISPKNRVLMFSATFGIAVQSTAGTFLRPNYLFITVGKLNSTVETVQQQFIEVQKFAKQDKLLELLKSDAIWKTHPNGDPFLKPAKKTLIFVETKRNSDRLAIALTQEKFYNTQSLNSDRTLEQRHLAVRNFIQGQYDVLVSTDVAARGVNIRNVEHVINYDLPEEDSETYIHRIGRTGRAGNTGLATSFFDPTSSDDLGHAEFYVEVLRQAQLPVPDFLCRYAPDFSSSWKASNFGTSSDVPPCEEVPIGGNTLSGRQQMDDRQRYTAQNNSSNNEAEEEDSFWSVKEDELVWGRGAR